MLFSPSARYLPHLVIGDHDIEHSSFLPFFLLPCFDSVLDPRLFISDPELSRVPTISWESISEAVADDWGIGQAPKKVG